MSFAGVRVILIIIIILIILERSELFGDVIFMTRRDWLWVSSSPPQVGQPK